jgi:serine/threonine protein kinase
MPSDIWALGITLYCITNNGMYPFEGDNYDQLVNVTSQYNGELYPVNNNMPRLNDMIKDCLKAFHVRPSATELLIKHFTHISQPPNPPVVPINANQ